MKVYNLFLIVLWGGVLNAASSSVASKVGAIP